MQIVPPSGPKDAKIAIVGEAPGAEEDRKGKPFVGRSGEKLEECLHMAQIQRTSVYLTNVVKERPPSNDISKFISFTRSGAKTTEKYELYVESLKKELEELKPNVVVALGAVPLYALTGERSIGNWRGSIIESTLIPGLKVIPTYHPAAALRNYTFSYQIVHDFLKVKRESGSPEICLPNPNMQLRPKLDEAITYLRKCKENGICAVDIEVVSQEIECLAFAVSDMDSCCIVLYDNNPVFTLEEEDRLWEEIAILLGDPDVVKIFQNAVFDTTFIYERYGIKTENIEDTMVAQGLVTPDFPKSLAFIGSIYTDYPFYKEEGKEWYKNPAGSAEGFWRYNCLDTLVTFGAFEPLMHDIERLGLLETYRSHIAIIPPIIEMQERGIKVDQAGMEAASKQCGEDIVRLTKELHELTGMELNPNSPKQLQNYFYVNKGIRPYVKDGRPTTDEKAMIKIASKGYPEARMILDIRQLKKLKSTYLDVGLDNGRIKCSYNPIGTKTGRLSSSKNIFGVGTNMQNQPREMKAFMHVDDGYIGYNVDLAGAENRNVAYCGPVPIMRSAFDKGLDVHRLTASLIFGIPYEEVSDEPGSSDLGNGAKSQRYWGKMMNHSSNYGIGKRGLALSLEIAEKEAGLLLEAYHSQYPEVRMNYQEQIKTMLRNGRRVLNPFGRVRIFHDRWGEGLFMDAYAHFSQSTVADIINRWGLPCVQRFPQVELLNQVHDSIVFQIHKDKDLEFHAAFLNTLRESLERSINWKSVTYKIPTDFEMIRSSFADTIKLHPPFKASDLEAALDN